MNRNSKWLYGSAILLLSAGFAMALIGSFPKEKKGQEISKSAPLSFSAKDSRSPAAGDAKALKNELPEPEFIFSSILKPAQDSPSVLEISQATQLAITEGREVQLDPTVFDSVQPGKTVELHLDLFNGKKIQVESRLEASSLAGGVYIHGRIKDDPLGWVSLTHIDGILVGHIQSKSSVYQIIKSTSGPHRHFLVQLNKSKLIRDNHKCAMELDSSKEKYENLKNRKQSLNANGLLSPVPQTAGPVTAAAVSPVIVRIYLVYDQSAINAAGGENAVRVELSNHVSTTNKAFAQSLIETQLEIAGFEKSSYNADGETIYRNHLDRIMQGVSPFSRIEDSLRATNADLTLLYIHPSASGYFGLAYLGSPTSNPQIGYGVASRVGDDGTTIPHEIGHMFGARHDEKNAGNGLPAYARGYINHNLKFGTIMSYRATEEYVTIPYFSSPALTYNGITIGSSQSGDNSRRINESRARIASYDVLRLPERELAFVILKSGEGFVLNCPRPTISNATFQWYFEGKPIPGATISRYVIENIQPNQRGAYFCFITNGKEKMNNGPTAVAVDGQVGPVILGDLATVPPLDWHTPLNLNVDVYAAPQPTFQWFRWDGTSWAAISGQTQATLNFAKLDWKDQGRYAVQVQNSLGQKMSSYVTIGLKPVTRGGLVVDLDPAGVQKSFTLIRTGGFEEVENKGAARPAQ